MGSRKAPNGVRSPRTRAMVPSKASLNTERQKRACAQMRECSSSAIAKNGIAIMRRTVILLARVIDRVFPEDLGEGRGMGADAELEASVGRFLGENVGVFMDERQARPVGIGDEDFFFGPLPGERR